MLDFVSESGSNNRKEARWMHKASIHHSLFPPIKDIQSGVGDLGSYPDFSKVYMPNSFFLHFEFLQLDISYVIMRYLM